MNVLEKCFATLILDQSKSIEERIKENDKDDVWNSSSGFSPTVCSPISVIFF